MAPIPIQGEGSLVEAIRNLPQAEGLREDSWLALDYVFDVQYEAGDVNFVSPDTPPTNTNIYDFRPDAMVHFILISDTGRPRHWGDHPVRPWIEDPEYGDPDFAEWDQVNIGTLLTEFERGVGAEDDIVLTAFVPAKFQPSDTETFVPYDNPGAGSYFAGTHLPILGVDANIIDLIDIDAHNPSELGWTPGDPEDVSDEYVITYAGGIEEVVLEAPEDENDTGQVLREVVTGNLLREAVTGIVLDTNKIYQSVIADLSCDPNTHSSDISDSYDAADDMFNFVGLIDQDQIDTASGGDGSHEHGIEEHAFLAWETKGAVWTSAYLGYDLTPDFPTDELQFPEGFRPEMDPGPNYQNELGMFKRLHRLLAGAMAQDVVNKITGPRVTSVAIVGPNTVDGDDGEYSIPDGSGAQLKTVPIGGANIIKVTFSEDVKGLEKGDLSLTGALEGTDYGPGVGDAFEYNRATLTATWTFDEPFPPDMMELELAGFTDRHNFTFDGNWTNPDTIYDESSDVFPSGNGITGGEFDFHFTIMPGDIIGVNADPNVDNAVGLLSDYTTLITNAANSGQQGSFGYHDGDLTGDGNIDIADLTILASTYLKIWDVWGLDSLFGDVNDDGAVNGLDVAAFVGLMTSGLYDIAGDMNEDGAVNGLDVELFVAAITGG